MNDGHRFSTPALIEPGWLLNVPSRRSGLGADRDDADDIVPVGCGQLRRRLPAIRTGESPRTISIRQRATVDVAAYTEELIDINARDARLPRPPTDPTGRCRSTRVGRASTAASPAPEVECTPARDASDCAADRCRRSRSTVATPVDVPPPPVERHLADDTDCSRRLSRTTGRQSRLEPTPAASLPLSTTGRTTASRSKRGLAAAALLAGGAVARARRRVVASSCAVPVSVLASWPRRTRRSRPRCCFGP